MSNKRTVLFVFCLICISIFFSQISFAGEETPLSTKGAILALIEKDGKNFTVKNLERMKNEVNYQANNVYKNKGGYYGVVVSDKGNMLGYFPANELCAVIFWDNFGPKGKDSGGCKEMTKAEIKLRIPFFFNGKYADIYDPKGNKVLRIDFRLIK